MLDVFVIDVAKVENLRFLALGLDVNIDFPLIFLLCPPLLKERSDTSISALDLNCCVLSALFRTLATPLR